MTPYITTGASRRRARLWAYPLFAALLLLVFLAVAQLMPPAQGADQSDVLRQQLAEKLTALEQANSQLQALAAELETLEQAKDTAAAKLAELDGDIVEVQDDIEQAESDLETIRVHLENRLVNLYKYGGTWSTRYWEALLVEEDLSAVLSRFELLSDLADQDQAFFAEVEGYLEKSRADKVLLEQKRAEQKAQLDELVEAEKQLVAKKSQFASLKSNLQSQISSLNEQIRQAEAAEAAAAAARVRAVTDAANKASSNIGGGSSYGGSSYGGSSSAAGYPSSAAEVNAQANFIYKTYLVPRKSVLSGMQVMEIWRKYNITPAQSLAILNAESGMGSLRWGGRLVSEGNNFGCMSYSSSPPWAKWPPAISHGKIYVGGRAWMKFYSVADGIEAWGRYIANGLGRDVYRPLLRAGDWEGFADIYYGSNVAGKAKYLERVTWAYGMLKQTSSAAGYRW